LPETKPGMDLLLATQKVVGCFRILGKLLDVPGMAKPFSLSYCVDVLVT
jgi:hypothetical protein